VRAVVADAFGDVGAVRVADVPRPEVGARDVLIRVAYAGVNPSDWKELAGGLADSQGRSLVVPSRHYTFPMITGRDASGVVAAVGAEVTDLDIGQPVVTLSDGPAAWGTFAEFVRVRCDRVAPIPPTLSLREGAAFPVAATTAWQALGTLTAGAVRPGPHVLVHGGSGGVGTFAVQLACLSGASVAATARHANAAYVRSLGAELVVDYQAGPLQPAVRAWRPDGVEVVVDTVGGPSAVDLIDLIRPGGRLVSVATITDDDDGDELHMAAAARGVAHDVLIVTSKGARAQLSALADLLAAGRLRLPKLQVFELDGAAEALRTSRAGRVVGKLVLRVGDAERS
jgi:NADPH2:quinone reductase